MSPLILCNGYWKINSISVLLVVPAFSSLVLLPPSLSRVLVNTCVFLFLFLGWWLHQMLQMLPTGDHWLRLYIVFSRLHTFWRKKVRDYILYYSLNNVSYLWNLRENEAISSSEKQKCGLSILMGVFFVCFFEIVGDPRHSFFSNSSSPPPHW